MSKYLIAHRGIEHGIVTDAPFVGSRICAMSCDHNCPGCFNQEMKNAKYYIEDVDDIIYKVKINGISEGIILGGLEWSENSLDMMILIRRALDAGLKVMLYTHHEFDYIIGRFPTLCGLDLYIKCGEYRRKLPGYFDSRYDVLLASKNQRIYHMLDY